MTNAERQRKFRASRRGSSIHIPGGLVLPGMRPARLRAPQSSPLPTAAVRPSGSPSGPPSA